MRQLLPYVGSQKQVHQVDQTWLPPSRIASLACVCVMAACPLLTNLKTPKARTVRKDPCDSKGYAHTQTHNHKHTNMNTQLQARKHKHKHNHKHIHKHTATNTATNTVTNTQPQRHIYSTQPQHTTTITAQPEDPQKKSRTTKLTTMATCSSPRHEDK